MHKLELFYRIDFVSDPLWDSTWNNSIPWDHSSWEHSTPLCIKYAAFKRISSIHRALCSLLIQLNIGGNLPPICFDKYLSGNLFLCPSNSKLYTLWTVSKFINICVCFCLRFRFQKFKVIILQFLAVKPSGTVSI